MSKFLKTLVAAAGDRRAVITQRLDGLIHVGFEQWDDTAVGSTGGYNDPFWRPDGDGILVPPLLDRSLERLPGDLASDAPPGPAGRPEPERLLGLGDDREACDGVQERRECLRVGELADPRDRFGRRGEVCPAHVLGGDDR